MWCFLLPHKIIRCVRCAQVSVTDKVQDVLEQIPVLLYQASWAPRSHAWARLGCFSRFAAAVWWAETVLDSSIEDRLRPTPTLKSFLCMHDRRATTTFKTAPRATSRG